MTERRGDKPITKEEAIRQFTNRRQWRPSVVAAFMHTADDPWPPQRARRRFRRCFVRDEPHGKLYTTRGLLRREYPHIFEDMLEQAGEW